MSVASISLQATASSSNRAHVKILNASVSYVYETPQIGLRVHPMALESIRVVIYADASFANNSDFSTQLGYMILLTADSARTNPIHFSSNTSHRVVTSVLRGELYALPDAVDLPLVLKQELRSPLSRDIPVIFLRYSLAFSTK